jgi:hypothetical protein
MKAFTYERPTSPSEAAAAVVRTPGAKFIAGGTNLLDLMKLQIETPTHLVDVNRIGLDTIDNTEVGRASPFSGLNAPRARTLAGTNRESRLADYVRSATSRDVQ